MVKTLTIQVKYVLEMPDDTGIEEVNKVTREIDILYKNHRLRSHSKLKCARAES